MIKLSYFLLGFFLPVLGPLCIDVHVSERSVGVSPASHREYIALAYLGSFSSLFILVLYFLYNL